MSLKMVAFYIIIAFLIYIDILLILKIIVKKLKIKEKIVKKTKRTKALLDVVKEADETDKRSFYVEDYFETKQYVQFDKIKREYIEKHIDIAKTDKKQAAKLKSVFKDTRIQAAIVLGLSGTDFARREIEERILKESDYRVKLYMANALSDIGAPESIPILVESLYKSPFSYRKKVNVLISSFGSSFQDYLPTIIKDSRIEIVELIVDFSSVYYSDILKQYLIKLIDTREQLKNEFEVQYNSIEPEFENKRCLKNSIKNIILAPGKNKKIEFFGNRCDINRVLFQQENVDFTVFDLVQKSAEVLAKFYPKVLTNPNYFYTNDLALKNIAIKSLSFSNSKYSILRLLNYIKDPQTSASSVYAISRIIESNPELIKTVVLKFQEEKDEEIKKKLAEILAIRVEYFIMRLTYRKNNYAVDIIKMILVQGKTSEIIDFLNRNKDINIENELIAVIKDTLVEAPQIKGEFSKYLNERILKKLKIEKVADIAEKSQKNKDKKVISKMYVLLAIIILIFPLMYISVRFNTIDKLNMLDNLKLYVVDFNYYFAYYSIVINSIYILLLIISFYEAKKQLLRWRIKKTSMLFKQGMLPSISIIAPAYNEEKTIIDSANSLLNLKYSNYELIIVNDGSKDRTLEFLIKYFKLKRVDYSYDERLKTKRVRGVYINRAMTKLIVVDKENGGKADSLNTGINIAKKEYFCGIDADSLLEDDALLKLASMTLDEMLEIPALGGNIFPINGCTVERGQIKEIRVSKNNLARFQTIEYMRSFLAGRLGWASINSLLIISGAFGLFRKERVTCIGGYLSDSSIYAKDTVGEDMELVVRVHRFMRELRHKYKIFYSYNANCWTEVPEDIKSLRKQRCRWHKGLIDVLFFHKKMIINPRYGKVGMISMTYYFVFEMVGPLIEAQGYIIMVLAAILGLFNIELALLLFISTILMGILVSISSILVAEKDLEYFKLKDILILIAFAFLENFGFRQWVSFWRVRAYFNMLKDTKGWEKAERKGFGSSNEV